MGDVNCLVLDTTALKEIRTMDNDAELIIVSDDEEERIARTGQDLTVPLLCRDRSLSSAESIDSRDEIESLNSEELIELKAYSRSNCPSSTDWITETQCLVSPDTPESEINPFNRLRNCDINPTEHSEYRRGNNDDVAKIFTEDISSSLSNSNLNVKVNSTDSRKASAKTRKKIARRKKVIRKKIQSKNAELSEVVDVSSENEEQENQEELYQVKSYKCNFCDFVTPIEEIYHHHHSKHIPGSKPYIRLYCPDCSHSTGSLKYLFFHMRKKHKIKKPSFYRSGEKMYTCSRCKKTEELRIDIEAHSKNCSCSRPRYK